MNSELPETQARITLQGPGEKSRQISGRERFTGTHKATELTLLHLEHSRTHTLVPDLTLLVCPTRFPPPLCSCSSEPGKHLRHPHPRARGPTVGQNVPPKRVGARALDAPLLDCAPAHAAPMQGAPGGWNPGSSLPPRPLLGKRLPPLAKSAPRSPTRPEARVSAGPGGPDTSRFPALPPRGRSGRSRAADTGGPCAPPGRLNQLTPSSMRTHTPRARRT